MVADLAFEAYRWEVARKAAEKVTGFLKGPAGKYNPGSVCQAGFGDEPVPYPGCTVLAKPYPLEQTISGLLGEWRDILANRSTGFVPVPQYSLHMTVADLVAGTAYLELRAKGWDAALHRRVQSILAAHPLEHPIQGTICGVGAFPNSLIAFVDFETPAAYNELSGLRDVIYQDADLARFGVERQFPIIGHVTLGYVESDMPSGSDEALDEIRHMLGRTQFWIKDVGLFIFSDMSHYREAA